jgi:hypothetical protein
MAVHRPIVPRELIEPIARLEALRELLLDTRLILHIP